MNCPVCERTSPADSRFCIYCSAQLSSPAPVVQEAPAVGPTVRLSQEAPASGYTMPAPAPIPAPAVPLAAGNLHRMPRHFKEASGAFFLIGLGVLFLTGSFWPGILVLVGVTAFISESGRGRQNKGLAALVFFSGLAVLFATGAFFPGILILLGIMALLNSKRSFWS